MGIAWSEYWDFLGCYADFSSEEGLEKLENYLRERSDCIQRQQMLETDLNMVSTKLNQLNLSSPDFHSCSIKGKSIVNCLGGGGGGDTLILYLDKNIREESSEDEHGDGITGKGDVPNANHESGSDDKLTPVPNPLSPTDDLDANAKRSDASAQIATRNSDYWHTDDIPMIDDSDNDSDTDTFYTAVDHVDSDVESLFTPPQSPSRELKASKYFIYG